MNKKKEKPIYFWEEEIGRIIGVWLECKNSKFTGLAYAADAIEQLYGECELECEGYWG